MKRRPRRVPDSGWVHAALRLAVALAALLGVMWFVGPEALPPDWGWR